MTDSKAKSKDESHASKPSKSQAIPKRPDRTKPSVIEVIPVHISTNEVPAVAETHGDAPVRAIIKSREQATGNTASRLIDQRIQELGGWRGETLARMRALILKAVPDVVEEWKWNNPVWSHHGIVCTGEAYTKVVKLTFAKGASVPDPAGLFNASLEGNTRRAIDIHEGEKVEGSAFRALVKATVALNAPPPKQDKPSVRKAKSIKARDDAKNPVPLLAGGNPQIAKGYGNAPVQAFIEAMPGWKSDVGRRLDALISRTIPDVFKAVKWNSPLYGVQEQVWFLGIHCFTKYVKVAFFKGASLNPIPPGKSKQKEVRYLDIRENDPLDEVQLVDWITQASRLPGERM